MAATVRDLPEHDWAVTGEQRRPEVNETETETGGWAARCAAARLSSDAASVEAISWALNLAPVPAGRGGQPSSACKFVLVGLANHAGPDGTGRPGGCGCHLT
jgi:hypothetical protein